MTNLNFWDSGGSKFIGRIVTAGLSDEFERFTCKLADWVLGGGLMMPVCGSAAIGRIRRRSFSMGAGNSEGVAMFPRAGNFSHSRGSSSAASR